ncbi:MAG: glycosyltransferase [Candidatus Hodarchaeota archaeon]
MPEAVKDMYKVFLTGGDSVRWATADDLNLLQKCLSSFCEFTDLQNCNIIHSVTWYGLVNIDPKYLSEKYVITHISHDIKIMLMQPRFLRVLPFVDRWIVMSKRAKRMLDESYLVGDYVPYYVDIKKFHRLDKNEPKFDELRTKYNIPSDKYLVGSFQRDTEGIDLKTPKYMKGPDVFFEIIKRLYQHKKNICVILAGPRRFWLLRQLSRNSIPFIYVGKMLDEVEDDIHINTLPQETINYLYNMIDLYLVTSRLEGGPKAITECSAAKCKIISTNVGQSADILMPETIYSDPIEGLDLILNDIETNELSDAVEPNYNKIIEDHNLEIVERYWRRIYRELIRKEKQSKVMDKLWTRGQFNVSLFNRFRDRIIKRKLVTILHSFHKPPWGGGNQFLLALKRAIKNKGWKVYTKLGRNSKMCILNSFTFNMKLIMNQKKDYNNICMVHRVDGPTFLVRGGSKKDKDLDDKVFEINDMIADITVFQSYWSYQKSIELGYKPKRPVIIPNAVDPTIFNHNGRIPFSSDRKIRLISTSWSSNLFKGFKTLKWIEEHLDWDKFEYTFVGNTPLDFDYIHHIPPQPSETLGELLRNHDIYITASRNDPCSNALLEALACGLPALYLNEGGHPELVGYGGLRFDRKEEILPQLNRLVKNYELFQNLIAIPTLDDVADKYLSLFGLWQTLKNYEDR